MIHSIISWDCCFRNFYHLIKSLSEQYYDKDQYELIFVEQRTKEESDLFNIQNDLPTLNETANNFRNLINVKAIFMNDDKSIPYNIGRCINHGIKVSTGKYVSRMDGDILVKKNFLHDLELAHKEYKTIINLDRRYSTQPVGATFENWCQGEIDYKKCLSVCANPNLSPQKIVENKGPLISVPRTWFFDVGGYDEHRIWSTGISRNGQDITKRMEIYSGKQSIALPNHLCVHPYHPQGFNRYNYLSELILDLQQRLIEYCNEFNIYKIEDRNEITEYYYKKYNWAIEANINSSDLDIFHKCYIEFFNNLKNTKTRIKNVLKKLSKL